MQAVIRLRMVIVASFLVRGGDLAIGGKGGVQLSVQDAIQISVQT